jgi:hypothetical protein
MYYKGRHKMSIKDELTKVASQVLGELTEKKGVFGINANIAERKVFLSVKKLTYSAKIKVYEDKKEVHFSEMIKEAGAGISSGFGSDTSPGFGFKKEVYKTGSQGREGSIEEQSKLFGKDYTYKFDYSQVRKAVEAVCGTLGYKFIYHILPNF